MTQQARNCMLAMGERVDSFGFLVRDRDTKFTASFDAVFAAEGITALRSPLRAPKADAYAERWVSTIRHECLDRMLICNEGQLVRVLAEYEDHYNTPPSPSGLEQRAPTEDNVPRLPHAGDQIRRKQILGGLINEYRHAASESVKSNETIGVS